MLMERYGQGARDDHGPCPSPAPRTGDDIVVDVGDITGEPTASRPIVNQTDLVWEFVESFGTSATTRQIYDKLTAAGYNLEYEQVRSALGYLRRKKRIVHVGPATWRVPQMPAVKDSTPDADTPGVDQADENGHSSQGGVLTGAGAWPHSQ